ncbi:hypothetical protein DFJ73DRAFT_780531 [Zopfochytrium polystomum]|nr:hypothetical protein DFJ73DRAFT_780531 [Zopfochytrium polystomum]
MTPQPYNGSSAHQSPQNFLQQHLTGGGGNGNPDFSGPTGHSSSPLTQSWDLAQGAHIRAPKAEISSPGWGPAPLLSTSRQPSQLGFSPNAILESNDESLEARVRAASTLLDELYQRVVAQESVPPSDSLTATTPTATGASQLHDRLHPGAVGLGQDGAANAGRLRASSPLVAPMQRRHSVEPSSLFGPNSGSSVLFSPTPPAMSPSLSASPLPSLKGANPLTLQLRLQLAAQRAAGNNADSSRISSAATNASSSSSAGGSGTSPTSSATLQLPVGAGNSAASSPRQPSASVVEEFIVRVSAAGPGRLLRHLTDGHSNGIAAIGTGRPSSPALLSPPASASGTTSVSPTPTLLHHFLGGSGKRDDEEAAQDIPSTTGTLIDWRASCERAAAEVARLRAALAKREAEYERLEAAHKGCGYIENLLAICD